MTNLIILFGLPGTSLAPIKDDLIYENDTFKSLSNDYDTLSENTFELLTEAAKSGNNDTYVITINNISDILKIYSYLDSYFDSYNLEHDLRFCFLWIDIKKKYDRLKSLCDTIAEDPKFKSYESFMKMMNIFNNPNNMKKNAELVHDMYHTLMTSKYLKSFVGYIPPNDLLFRYVEEMVEDFMNP